MQNQFNVEYPQNLPDLLQVTKQAFEDEARMAMAVKRNIKRFPSDFMFQITREEWENLKSQFVTSRWGGIRKMPFAFTEQGVAMLSSVLNSDLGNSSQYRDNAGIHQAQTLDSGQC